jgi:hypothetical protein
MTYNITKQNIDLSSWITLYVHKYAQYNRNI